MSFTQRRVSGPVIGLKRIPSATPGDQQRGVPAGVVLLALEPVSGVPQVVDGVAQLVANLVVRRDTRRDRDRAAAAEQLVVELRAVPNALITSSRSFSSRSARSTYGLTSPTVP